MYKPRVFKNRFGYWSNGVCDQDMHPTWREAIACVWQRYHDAAKAELDSWARSDG